MAKSTNSFVSSKTPSTPEPSAKTPSAPATSVKTTVSRNSPVPRPEPVKREVTHEMVAKRAYEIFVSGTGGSQTDNWLRAERELKGI